MNDNPRRALFVEEGAAFVELEGRQLAANGKAASMTTREQISNAEQQHFAPVEAWDAIADAYDRYVAPGEVTLATFALRRAGLERGHRFLDVAAGTGGLTLPAARLGAKVVATDWSPKMIARFESRARDERLADAEGKVMDCHALAFPDDSFDVTGSLFGVMLVPDQAKALREMVRVTKPGGRVLVIAYGAPSEFEALHLFIAGLRAVQPAFEGLPSDPPPLEFQVADPKVLEQRLEAAGLRNVVVDTTQKEHVELRSGMDLWNWCLGSNPIPNMLVADLSETQKASMRAAIDQSIRARANGRDHLVVTAPLNIGFGTK